VHIAFQRSGGRGEYEVVGSHSGYTAISLEGWTFNVRWPDGIVRETGLGLEPATSGKPRLRSLLSPQFQVGRILAAMLMLPEPRREYQETSVGYPVAREKGYVLTRLGFGPETEFASAVDLVTIEPSFVELENQTQAESIGVAMRWARIQEVYARIEALPPAVSSTVTAHSDFLASGEVITGKLSSIVKQICNALGASDASYTAGHDPLRNLERMVGMSASTGPTLPPPDRLGEDEPEVSARSAHQYRLAIARGASARKFSLDVREAYGHRCAFCGAVLGGVRGIRPGVDAAHILAWSKHDLDVIRNGICLCKLHHWAFDAAILVPVLEKGGYRLRFTTLSEKFDAASMARLGADGFEVPDGWLPSDTTRRPSAKYLDRLYTDLAVTFVA
jgi:hypothetical protein